MILGLGPLELLVLVGLLVGLFGLGRLPLFARRLGRLHGTFQRLQDQFPWLSRIPGLSRFLRR